MTRSLPRLSLLRLTEEPIVVTNIGGSFGAKAFVVTAPEIPRTLKPGEYISSHTDDFSVPRADLKYLAAYDSFNRVFKAPRRQVSELKQSLAAGEIPGADGDKSPQS